MPRTQTPLLSELLPASLLSPPLPAVPLILAQNQPGEKNNDIGEDPTQSQGPGFGYLWDTGQVTTLPGPLSLPLSIEGAGLSGWLR